MQMLRDSRHVAGMPELAYAGLAESWLLKQCGQRHWRAIAAAGGRKLPRFQDTAGRTAYAAFTAISVQAARLEQITEHAPFTIATGATPAGRSQYFSRHVLRSGGQRCARLNMLSAFVYRGEAGNNQSVARAEVGAGGATAPLPEDAVGLLEASAAARRGQPDCTGLAPAGAELEWRFSPCPNSDFNGANFLYFAAFRDAVERAEWSWFRRCDLPALDQRQLYFFGNVNVGDDIVVRLMAQRHGGDELEHWCRVLRGSDGARIADVVTRKRASSGRTP